MSKDALRFQDRTACQIEMLPTPEGTRPKASVQTNTNRHSAGNQRGALCVIFMILV